MCRERKKKKKREKEICFPYLSKEIKETISLEITVDLIEQTTTFYMKNANNLTDILETQF